MEGRKSSFNREPRCKIISWARDGSKRVLVGVIRERKTKKTMGKTRSSMPGTINYGLINMMIFR